MTCTVVRLPTGQTAIVCSSTRGRRCACGRRAPLLCDWKVEGKKSGTCDRPICERCTTSPSPDKDLCPEHATAWVAWKSDRAHSSDGAPTADERAALGSALAELRSGVNRPGVRYPKMRST